MAISVCPASFVFCPRASTHLLFTLLLLVTTELLFFRLDFNSSFVSWKSTVGPLPGNFSFFGASLMVLGYAFVPLIRSLPQGFGYSVTPPSGPIQQSPS